jgi:hypothetical protein
MLSTLTGLDPHVISTCSCAALFYVAWGLAIALRALTR